MVELLSIRDLKVRLGSGEGAVRPVDGIELTIRPGETFALLGESGCGKSMTALSVMRLLPPSGRIGTGSICLQGESLLDLPEQAMRGVRGGRIGMIFQEPMTSLNPVLTVLQQVGEAVQVHDPANRDRIPARVEELLRSVGIPDPARRLREYPHQLSGGMKQRVMIAMALAGRPEMLIADEPTTALDVTIQAQVLALLKELQRETGMAVLLITHDLGVVAEVADRVAVMYAGRIVETAPVGQFFGHARHPYSRKLFASLPDKSKRDRPLEVIPGSVPRLNQSFVGCRFADRCGRVADLCRGQEPPWQGEGPDHRVACHFPVDGPDGATAPEAAGEAVPTPPDRGGGPLLEVSDLRVHFPIRRGVFQRVVGKVRAVDGVSLTIAPGRTLALVGESGCGKTTVGKAILKLGAPFQGSVRFDGEDLAGVTGQALRRRRRDMQIIFQDPYSSMNPRMLVGDIVAEGLVAQRMVADRPARIARVAELLARVGLPPEAAQRYPHEFSGGQRQRICIARALAVQPRLIVCDEPTSALDVSVQAQILNLLKELQVNHGMSYLFVTHNLPVVSYLAHEVAVMYLGRIVEQGSAAEILEAPRHPYTQALLASAPEGDPAHRREAPPLLGDLPSPANPPAGCHFHPRCPLAGPECRTVYPDARQLSPTHRVSCVRVDR